MGSAAVHRRRFKLAGGTTSCNTIAFVAAAVFIVALMAGLGPSTHLTGAVHSATQYMASASLPDPDLPCKDSGYCSIGKTTAYIGEVDTTEGLKAALESTCYKKECFLVTIGSRSYALGLNFVWGAWRKGLANVILHASNNESCAEVAQLGYQNVTCVWATKEWWPIKTGDITVQWALRYLIMARAVWLGYNIMLMDSDSYLYREPYKYLKSPPFKDVKWISLSDNGAEQINGGFQYIQNADPGGPAAWTIAAMVERVIRVDEQWDWWLAGPSGHTHKDALGHAMMDQFVMSDIMATNRMHHPYIKYTMDKAPGLPEDVNWWLQYRTPGVQLCFPEEWQDLFPKDCYQEMGFNMTIPFLNGHWNESLGGKTRHPPWGNYSKAWAEWLEKESGHKFYDMEGNTPEGFVQPPPELFIMAPIALLGTWNSRGSGGWWNLDPPKQVLGHVLFLGGHHEWQKEYVLKATNAWNFEVSQALTGQAFPSATPDNTMPRVLSLMPGTRIPAESAKDYRDKIRQLVRLGMRTGRQFLIPDPVCGDKWLKTNSNEEKVDNHTRHNTNHFLVMRYGLDDDEHCVWWWTLRQDCMPDAYIAHPDYIELVRRLPAGTGVPSSANTVSGAGDLRAAEAAANSKAELHILFLDAVPDLANAPAPEEGGADDRWKKWTEECKWAKEDPLEP